MAELIVAFDLPTGQDALRLADRLPELRWAKLGPVLFVREGPALVREFRARGVRVFLDLKWHDIPSTVQGAVAAARDLGVSLATVHCLGGPAMLAAAVAAAGELPLVGVTVLTSHDAREWGAILGGRAPDLSAEAVRLAQMAQAAGLRGVVSSGAEVRVLREALGPDAWLVVPGIRAPGEPQGDQSRTVSAAEAVQGGATHLVVGRPVTRAADPAAAFRRVVTS